MANLTALDMASRRRAMWIKKPTDSAAEPVKADEPKPSEPTATERRRKAMYDQAEMAEVMRRRTATDEA